MRERNDFRQVQVVVVDDVCRFALHVWRSLGRSIVLGTGRVPARDDEERPRFWSEPDRPNPLEAPDGRFALWWIPADSNFNRNLEYVDKSLRSLPADHFGAGGIEDSLVFLLDVCGVRGECFENGNSQYSVDQAVESIWTKYGNLLDVEPKRIWIVSSYEVAPIPLERLERSLEVLPKTPNTLRRIAETFSLRPDRSKEGGSARSDAPAVDGPGRKEEECGGSNILVTGAGFEMREESQGSFGLPSTSSVLWKVFPAEGAVVTSVGNGEDGREEKEFPKHSWKWEKRRTDGFWYRFKESAEKKRLDDYWDALIEKNVWQKMESIEDGGYNRQEQEALAEELRLRGLFRSAILEDDWGHMNQHLYAAEMPWAAWLSTNYTQFADRAIAVAKLADSSEGKWNVVASADEASLLRRRLLYSQDLARGDTEPSCKAAALQKEEGTPADGRDFVERYLFKLHGDIGRLQTMAIAGHDKRLFSPLTVPIESLSDVYGAAETYLPWRLARVRGSGLVWHIVGHALGDRLLVRLIEKISSQVADRAGRSKVRFVVVDPVPSNALKVLGGLDGDLVDRSEILYCETEAQRYISRIRRRGLLERETTAEEFVTELRSIGVKAGPAPES